MNKRHYTYLLACSLWLLISSAVQGQNIFQKRSDLPDKSHVIYNSVFPSDTGFFVLGWGMDIVPIDSVTLGETPSRAFMSWYNWTGELVKNKEFNLPTGLVAGMWYSANSLFNNGFYHYSSISDTSNTEANGFDTQIRKFDNNGDTIWTRRYDSGENDYGYACVTTLDGGVLGIGGTGNTGNTMQRVVRYDSTGNLLWTDIYNATYYSVSNYVLKDNTGNFYLGGATRPSGGQNPKNMRSRIVKINSQGSIIWNKPIPGICDEFSCAIDFAQDGNILVAKSKCYNQDNSQSVDNKIALFKISKGNGSIIWQKEFEPLQITDNDAYFVHQLNDGNIILGGSSSYLFYEGQDTVAGMQSGVFIKTDSLGNQLWQRQYFYEPENYLTSAGSLIGDAKPTPDGGFILVGRVMALSYDDGWILKTDANGCIDAGCVNGVEELEEDDYRLFIYPNPAQDYVSIDLPITNKKATLQIINMQGQVVKIIALNSGGLQHADISNLPKGMYIFTIQSNNTLIGREKVVVY